jgi:cell filamentation protein
MSKDNTEEIDPYIDSATGVLRNLLGIRDRETLSRVEADVTLARTIWLGENPLSGTYDLAHLQAFHRALFADIYAWAGELRTVVIARTDPFCLPQFLESAGADLFAAIRDDRYLRDLDRAQFVDRLSHHLGEVNALHPFREGNGRAQRAFFAQLARDAGWRIRWALLDPTENEQASRASLQGHPERLRTMIDRLVQPAQRSPGGR